MWKGYSLGMDFQCTLYVVFFERYTTDVIIFESDLKQW